MKILITGGAGFIGYHLAKILTSKGNFVNITDILNIDDFDEDLKNILYKKNCNYIKCNILEKNEIDNLPKNYDLIIHLAAIVGVENVISNSYGVLTKNQLMLYNILTFAETQKQKPRFIFASTSEVYAGSQFLNNIEYPTKENTILSLPDLSLPRTSYMLSKIYGEAMCHASNLNYLILRPHNIYGPRMGMKHVIPQLIKKIIYTKEEGTLDLFSPDHTRTFCYVKYAVNKIALFIEKENWPTNAINLGVEKPEIKIRDLAKMLLKIMSRQDISIHELENTQGSPSRRVPETSALNINTEFTEIPSLEEGIIETYNWYRKEINSYD